MLAFLDTGRWNDSLSMELQVKLVQEAVNLKGWMGATHSSHITHAQVRALQCCGQSSCPMRCASTECFLSTGGGRTHQFAGGLRLAICTYFARVRCSQQLRPGNFLLTQMMAALTPTDEMMTDASVAQLGTWAPVSEPVSIKPSVDVAVLVRACTLSRLLTKLRMRTFILTSAPSGSISIAPSCSVVRTSHSTQVSYLPHGNRQPLSASAHVQDAQLT